MNKIPPLGEGTFFERLIFQHRSWVLLFCLALTALLGSAAMSLRLNASFDKALPMSHPYIQNFLAFREDLQGLDNAIRIAVSNNRGTILDQQYLDTLQKVSDAVYLLPGVDRPYMKSLWTPSTRWIAVTEEGLDGGPVIPDGFKGTNADLEQLRQNIERSGEVGSLVALNLSSSIIYVPLLDKDPETGLPLDYGVFVQQLNQIRDLHSSENITIHVTGFAQVVGDLIDGLRSMLYFFLVAVLFAAIALFAYTRCLRSTALVVVCSLVAASWQLGALALAGVDLNAYSILVPFLVFAIGMSHGAQKMNGIMQDIGRGESRLNAARLTFRRLFGVGLIALLCDAVGFGVLTLIDIPVIQELAILSGLGVAFLVVTNLILLPVLLSYTGVSPAAVKRATLVEATGGAAEPVWRLLSHLGRRGPAAVVLVIAGICFAIGLWGSRSLQVGDLEAGAPELRTDSRYNRDTAFITENYLTSGDVLVVLLKTKQNECVLRSNLVALDELSWELEQLPGVLGTSSLASLSRQVAVGLNEGNFKWSELLQEQTLLNPVLVGAPRELVNVQCDLATLVVSLADHRASTLSAVVDTVEKFAVKANTENRQFLLGAGNAGIEAATNIVVRQAWWQMLALVYGAVALLCALTFRQWRPVLVALLPLMLTSILCEALMAAMGIGVKVATLPVIALGVGIGVDYALYLLGIMLRSQQQGASVAQAYLTALRFTGKVIVLTGVTLSLGVAMWIFSDIRFQADMGLLLAFMFIGNMASALLLVPALMTWFQPNTKKQSILDSKGVLA